MTGLVLGPFDRETWLMLLCLKSDLAVMNQNNGDGQYSKFIKDEMKLFKKEIRKVA